MMAGCGIAFRVYGWDRGVGLGLGGGGGTFIFGGGGDGMGRGGFGELESSWLIDWILCTGLTGEMEIGSSKTLNYLVTSYHDFVKRSSGTCSAQPLDHSEVPTLRR